MKAAIITADHEAKVKECEMPTVGPDDVLIRNKTCNICTTDYQQWQGLRPHQHMNMAFGHENCGVVEKVGANVKNVKVGDHVVSNAYRPCLECVNCRKGLAASFCLNPTELMKTPTWGGFYGAFGCSEYQVAASKHIFKVDSNMPFEYGNFCEPAATVISGVKRLNIQLGQKVVVIGAGTMGILNAQVARAFGADVMVSEITEKKLAVAKELGFEVCEAGTQNLKTRIDEFTDGVGVDAIIIAVGATPAYNQAIDASKIGGKLLIFASGYPTPSWNLDPNLVHYKILDVVGTFGCSTADYQMATELIASGKINVKPIIEKFYPIEDIQKAFEAAATKDMYRVIVRM